MTGVGNRVMSLSVWNEEKCFTGGSLPTCPLKSTQHHPPLPTHCPPPPPQQQRTCSHIKTGGLGGGIFFFGRRRELCRTSLTPSFVFFGCCCRPLSPRDGGPPTPRQAMAASLRLPTSPPGRPRPGELPGRRQRQQDAVCAVRRPRVAQDHVVRVRADGVRLESHGEREWMCGESGEREEGGGEGTRLRGRQSGTATDHRVDRLRACRPTAPPGRGC